MKATLYFDGSSSPHKGNPAGAGYVLEIMGGDTLQATQTVPETIGRTNNVAEYYALFLGLSSALQEGISEVHVIGDSQLIIYQMTGRYKVKNPELKKLYDRTKAVEQQLKVTYEWKRRVHNKADAISRPE